MPLRGPDDEDRRKLHQEITQVVNQRLLVTTFAVTVFGAVVAWSFPQMDAGKVAVPERPFIASVVLNVILTALLWLHHELILWARTLTTYLQETEDSGWEADWAEFRRHEEFEYEGYSKPQMNVFKSLGIISLVFPWALCLLYLPPVDLAHRVYHPADAFQGVILWCTGIHLRSYVSALLSCATGYIYLRFCKEWGGSSRVKAYEKKVRGYWKKLKEEPSIVGVESKPPV
ncbi:MAG: hypothetical protein HY010_12705 [Acidobacteria bacterium]|nr:hypothetical protein [Acidobacteriota bacterium]